MGTGITDVIGGPHDFLPPRSDEFQKLCYNIFFQLMSGVVMVVVFNATFYNISVISRRSVLLVEETETCCHDLTTSVRVGIASCKSNYHTITIINVSLTFAVTNVTNYLTSVSAIQNIVKPAHAVTCIKRSPFSSLVIENFI